MGVRARASDSVWCVPGAALSPPSSAVAVTVVGTDGTSGERTFAGSQRMDFQPGEKVDFRFEAAELGELKCVRLRLAPPPNLTHNLFQAVVADFKGESRPVSHGGHAGELGPQTNGMGYLRRWHISHAMVTHGKTMQTWTFPLDQTVTEDPVVEVDVLVVGP